MLRVLTEKAKNEFSGGYIRYRLDSTGEFSILSRENNEVMH